MYSIVDTTSLLLGFDVDKHLKRVPLPSHGLAWRFVRLRAKGEALSILY